MNLSKKLAVGLLMAGTMTGVGLAVASPAGAAGAAAGASTTVPQASFPRWIVSGTYPSVNTCANAGRMFVANFTKYADWKCGQISPPLQSFQLQLLETAP
jgi:hypothetical protein